MSDQILNIELPSDVPTAYADFASVWHTNDVFVMDFVAMVAPPSPAKGRTERWSRRRKAA